MKGYKQPVSVLVVIYTKAPESGPQVLLLERADCPGFWQSVTGSREGCESLAQTALREVQEETGLAGLPITDWQVQNSYPIFSRWLHRYAPGTTQNTEHVYGLRLDRPVPVRLAPLEHLNYRWLPWQEAAPKVFSPSNRAAILELPERATRPG